MIWYWIIITIVIILTVILFSITYYINRKNEVENISTFLLPFSGKLSPPSPPWTVNNSKNNTGVQSDPEDGLYLTGLVGGDDNTTPQISCPNNTKINIVGAFLEVNDPYGMCTDNPTSGLKLTCGTDINDAPGCSSDSDCGVGLFCKSGKCSPKTCNNSSDCISGTNPNIKGCVVPSNKNCETNDDCENNISCVNGKCSKVNPGSGACMACMDGDEFISSSSDKSGKCAYIPTCQNQNKGKNNICTDQNNNCKIRDASAYLASVCDGKSECLGKPSQIWKPNERKDNPFGPLPCSIQAKSNNNKYSGLPITSGWGGGTPNNSSSDIGVPANFEQGYMVHGIYTCVPD